MDKEITIDVLNTLITINNYRIEGYANASQETEEQNLKTMFAQFSFTSQICKQELKTEIAKLGGTLADSKMASGKFFRLWSGVQAALTGKDRKAIFNLCEYGEDMTNDTYEKTLKNDTENLSTEQQTMIKAQQILLVTDHSKVKTMRVALVQVL